VERADVAAAAVGAGAAPPHLPADEAGARVAVVVQPVGEDQPEGRVVWFVGDRGQEGPQLFGRQLVGHRGLLGALVVRSGGRSFLAAIVPREPGSLPRSRLDWPWAALAGHGAGP